MANYPAYIHAIPGATIPSRGASALTGTPLSPPAVGLIVKLNDPSVRHFAGEVGTANINIPVAVLNTLRFGVYRGKYERLSAEFRLRARYVADPRILRANDSDTNVSAYGREVGEVSHSDMRMLVKKEVEDGLTALLAPYSYNVPAIDDLALLEWPTAADPTFGLSFLCRETALYAQVEGIFSQAITQGRTLSAQDSTCYLPPGVSPPW